MSWKFCLLRSNVYNSSLFDSSTCPSIKYLLFFLLLFFLIPLDPSTQQAIKNLIDLHLFPLGRHEISLAGWMRRYGEWIIMLKLIWEIFGGNGLTGHLATPDPINDLKLLIRQHNIHLVEFVPNCPPPVLILRFLNELLNLI